MSSPETPSVNNKNNEETVTKRREFSGDSEDYQGNVHLTSEQRNGLRNLLDTARNTPNSSKSKVIKSIGETAKFGAKTLGFGAKIAQNIGKLVKESNIVTEEISIPYWSNRERANKQKVLVYDRDIVQIENKIKTISNNSETRRSEFKKLYSQFPNLADKENSQEQEASSLVKDSKQLTSLQSQLITLQNERTEKVSNLNSLSEKKKFAASKLLASYEKKLQPDNEKIQRQENLIRERWELIATQEKNIEKTMEEMSRLADFIRNQSSIEVRENAQKYLEKLDREMIKAGEKIDSKKADILKSNQRISEIKENTSILRSRRNKYENIVNASENQTTDTARVMDIPNIAKKSVEVTESNNNETQTGKNESITAEPVTDTVPEKTGEIEIMSADDLMAEDVEKIGQKVMTIDVYVAMWNAFHQSREKSLPKKLNANAIKKYMKKSETNFSGKIQVKDIETIIEKSGVDNNSNFNNKQFKQYFIVMRRNLIFNPRV